MSDYLASIVLEPDGSASAVLSGVNVDVVMLETAVVGGVASFNTRTGAVTLSKADVTGTGLAAADVGAAPLASPALTGTPTAPTATAGTSTTQLATTAFVETAVSGATAGVTSFNTRTGAVTLSKADVTGTGLAAADISAATTSALAAETSRAEAAEGLLAPLASPALTGTPTAPTATAGTNTTQVATTAFVETAVTAGVAGVSSFNTRTGAVTLSKADVTGTGLAASDIAAAPLASPTFTGTPAAPTATAGTNTTQVATTAFVQTATGSLAPQASPTFTGTPAAPTATAGTNTTQLATTAFVHAAVPSATTGVTAGSYTAANITVGSDGRLTAAANGSSGTTVGTIIGHAIYAPSTQTIKVSSSTLAPYDTTNLSVTFTAPSSGNVMVRLTGVVGINNGGLQWFMLNHSTATKVTNGADLYTANNTALAQSVVLSASGLTSGTVYTWDWGVISPGGTNGSLYCYDNSGAVANGGPAVIEVVAL